MSRNWSQPDVPHKGWVWIGIEDLGAPDGVCMMCGKKEVRYLHQMRHPEHSEDLFVGCVCAGHMTNDYKTPKEGERQKVNEARRKKRWLTRKWRKSVEGNSFINTDGMKITIFQHANANGNWGGTITNRKTKESIPARNRYASEDQAKLAAFDGMIFMKNKKGFGGQRAVPSVYRQHILLFIKPCPNMLNPITLARMQHNQAPKKSSRRLVVSKTGLLGPTWAPTGQTAMACG